MIAMVRTQISLTEAQLEALRELSQRSGESMAELVRRGVEHVLREAGGPSLEERRRRALAIAGRFSSGERDISVNHDRYLVEIYGA